MIRIVWLALLTSAFASAEDWPQWRGPARDGHVDWNAPDPWPDELVRRWRVEIGEGHASPAVVGGIVYQFARRGESEVLRALRLTDGRVQWETSYPAPYTMNPAARGHGKGPKSSPVVARGMVFTLGIHGIVSAHAAASGQRLWLKDTSSSPLYGHAMSPVVADDKLIVHLGEDGRGTLTSLDPRTGRTIWEHAGDGPGYASPIVVDGRIITQTDAHIVAVALETGELAWSIPFKTPYVQNIVTPIRHGNTLIFSGLAARTFAVAGSEPQEVWSNPLTFYMSTPVLVGDTLVGFSDKRSGHFALLDTTTGETRWTGPPRQGENAAIVAAGDYLLTLTHDAELSVVTVSGGALETVKTYTVADSPTWAHPVPTSDGILIKDKETLALWSAP